MRNNIYDLTTSELILRLEAVSAANINSTRLSITSTIGVDSVPENYNNTAVSFTSEVLNLPTGWIVAGPTHIMVYPTSEPDTIGATESITGAPTNVILGAAGSVFTVMSFADITDGNTTISLTTQLEIKSVLPIYFGVKPVPMGVPDTTNLDEISSESTTFSMITSTLGRIYIVIPTSSNGAGFTGLVGPSGLFTPVTDFVSTVEGSHNYYYTNYDTILTGNYDKNFEIKFT